MQGKAGNENGTDHRVAYRQRDRLKPEEVNSGIEVEDQYYKEEAERYERQGEGTHRPGYPGSGALTTHSSYITPSPRPKLK